MQVDLFREILVPVIEEELGIPVLLAKEPMDCSALGLGYLVENLQLLQSIGKQGFMQVE